MPGVGESVAVRQCRRIGLIGSALLAFGGLAAGALPDRGATPMPGLRSLVLERPSEPQRVQEPQRFGPPLRPMMNRF